MRVFIMDCGGVLGVPLVRWFLANTDATLAGSDQYHERLHELLDVPRFSYYASGDGDEIHRLIPQLVEESDVVVDLTSIEQRDINPDSIADFQQRLDRQVALARSCVAANVRLIHVASSGIYDRSSSTAPGGRGSADDPVGEEEARLIADPIDRVESARQNGERMVQQLIHAYGSSEAQDYVVLRLFDVLGSRLEELPVRGPERLLGQVREALLEGVGGAIPVNRDDHVVRAYVYVEDAVDCIGRAAAGREEASRQMINVGNPANQESAFGLAQRILQRYEERYGVDSYQRPTFHEFGDFGPGDDAGRLRPPSIEKARELLGWEPRWSLDGAIDDILSQLRRQEPI